MKQYDFIGIFILGFARVRLNSKWGFIDQNNKELCEIKYNNVGIFDNGFAKFELNNKYGFINEQGIEIIKPVYKYYEADKILNNYIKNQERNLKLNELV